MDFTLCADDLLEQGNGDGKFVSGADHMGLMSTTREPS